MHDVAAMRFGLVPAEVSGLEYTLVFESGGKKGRGTVVYFYQGSKCVPSSKHIKQDSALLNS